MKKIKNAFFRSIFIGMVTFCILISLFFGFLLYGRYCVMKKDVGISVVEFDHFSLRSSPYVSDGEPIYFSYTYTIEYKKGAYAQYFLAMWSPINGLRVIW